MIADLKIQTNRSARRERERELTDSAIASNFFCELVQLFHSHAVLIDQFSAETRRNSH